MESINRIAGAGGSRLIKTTAITNGDFAAISIREATVLSVLTGIDQNGVAVNYLAVGNVKGVIGLIATESLIAGDLITVPRGWKITNITLTSGSAWGY